MRKNNILVGVVLIAIGVLLIVNRTIGIEMDVWDFVWPLFLLIPGITMHIKYFQTDGASGSLLIAGILTVYGLGFLINVITGEVYGEYIKFMYPLGISIGFFENYFLGEKNSSSLCAGLVFLVVSVYIIFKNVFPELSFLRNYAVPALLILIGIYVLIKNNNNTYKS